MPQAANTTLIESQAQLEPQPSAIEQFSNIAQAMLQKEQGTEPQPRGPDGKFTKAPEAEAPETPQEGAEAPQEGAAEPEEPKVEAKTKYKVKYKGDDGSDVEAELEPEELVKGFMLQKDYSRKTADLARQREAAKEEARKEIAEKAKALDERYAEAEQVILDTAIPGFKNIDWNTLARENPAEWAAKFQAFQNVQSRLTAIRAARQAQAESFAKEQRDLLMKQAQEAVETLQTRIPGWSDDKYRDILKAAQSHYGFKAQEVGAITDPRAIEVLHDAMQFRALKAKPVADKKVAEKPKAVLKPGPGAETQAPNPSAKVLKETGDQLRKTGRREDAISHISALFEAGRLQ